MIVPVLKTAPSHLPRYEELDLTDLINPKQVRPVDYDIRLPNWYGDTQIIKRARNPKFNVRYEDIPRATLEVLEKWEQERTPVTFNGLYDEWTWCLFQLFRAAPDNVTIRPLIAINNTTPTFFYARTAAGTTASYIRENLPEERHNTVNANIARFTSGWQGLPGMIFENQSNNEMAPSHPTGSDLIWAVQSGSPTRAMVTAESHYTGVTQSLFLRLPATASVRWTSDNLNTATRTGADVATFSIWVKGYKDDTNLLGVLITGSGVDGSYGGNITLTSGWKRYNFELNIFSSGTVDVDLVGQSGTETICYVGGAQLELNNPGTSYMHTVGTTHPSRTNDRLWSTNWQWPDHKQGCVLAGITQPNIFDYDSTVPVAGSIDVHEYIFGGQSTYPHCMALRWKADEGKWSGRIGTQELVQASASAVAAGSSNLVGVSWQELGDIDLYDNGVRSDTAALPFVANAYPSGINIGGMEWTGYSDYDRGFSGVISWVRFDKVFRTQTDIEAICARLNDADEVRFASQFYGREFVIDGFTRNINLANHGRYTGAFELTPVTSVYQNTARRK